MFPKLISIVAKSPLRRYERYCIHLAIPAPL